MSVSNDGYRLSLVLFLSLDKEFNLEVMCYYCPQLVIILSKTKYILVISDTFNVENSYILSHVR